MDIHNVFTHPTEAGQTNAVVHSLSCDAHSCASLVKVVFVSVGASLGMICWVVEMFVKLSSILLNIFPKWLSHFA